MFEGHVDLYLRGADNNAVKLFSKMWSKFFYSVFVYEKNWVGSKASTIIL